MKYFNKKRRIQNDGNAYEMTKNQKMSHLKGKLEYFSSFQQIKRQSAWIQEFTL